MSPAQICVILALISCSSQAEAGPRKTELQSSYNRAFSRRKRAIIFPPGSFFKFTLNFSKGLLSTYPRGIAFNLEEAVYFPIPGTRDDLYPKKFLPKTTTTVKPKTTTPETFVYIPGTDWRFKAQALPKPKFGQKIHRIDLASSSNLNKWQKWTKYNDNSTKKWQTSINQAKWSKWTTPAPQWTREWTRHWQGSRPIVKYHRNYHGHRDRRQLFDNFSELSGLCVVKFRVRFVLYCSLFLLSSFGLDVKSCILRTICDSKHLLLPPGYSMLQDMLRLVFT